MKSIKEYICEGWGERFGRGWTDYDFQKRYVHIPTTSKLHEPEWDELYGAMIPFILDNGGDFKDTSDESMKQINDLIALYCKHAKCSKKYANEMAKNDGYRGTYALVKELRHEIVFNSAEWNQYYGEEFKDREWYKIYVKW